MSGEPAALSAVRAGSLRVECLLYKAQERGTPPPKGPGMGPQGLVMYLRDGGLPFWPASFKQAVFRAFLYTGCAAFHTTRPSGLHQGMGPVHRLPMSRSCARQIDENTKELP